MAGSGLLKGEKNSQPVISNRRGGLQRIGDVLTAFAHFGRPAKQSEALQYLQLETRHATKIHVIWAKSITDEKAIRTTCNT